MIYEPVTQGFVQNLAHPGGNTTGFTAMEATVGAKWLELLKDIAPQVTRIAFMYSPDNPGPMQVSRSVEAAATNFAVSVVKAPVHGPAEIEAAVTMLAREPGGGLIVPPDGFLLGYRKLTWPPTASTSQSNSAKQHPMWIAFCVARKLATFQCNNQPTTNWSSISRLPRRLVSPSH